MNAPIEATFAAIPRMSVCALAMRSRIFWPVSSTLNQRSV